MAKTRLRSWKWVFLFSLRYAKLNTETRKGYQMETLKWKITLEEQAQHKLAVKLSNRSLTKAEQEKEAKANGTWDYRNNKIVEA